MKTGLEWAKSILPERNKNSNKGSFGKLLMIVGSSEYRGAAHLSVESALRGGVGYVYFMGDKELCSELRMKYPEVIYKEILPVAELDDGAIEEIADYSSSFNAICIGSGCGISERLADLTQSVLQRKGGAVLLDADALNSIAKFKNAGQLLPLAKRSVVITPHSLELSRLSGIELSHIEAQRESVAISCSEKFRATVLLKGNGTVISGNGEFYINTSGSTALAKAGSGDALGGLLAALLASTSLSAPKASALAAYIHGAAADRMASIYSQRGVLISDMPAEMAKVLRELEKA